MSGLKLNLDAIDQAVERNEPADVAYVFNMVGALTARIRELEAENARWVQRIKTLEHRAQRAAALLEGKGSP